MSALGPRRQLPILLVIMHLFDLHYIAMATKKPAKKAAKKAPVKKAAPKKKK